MLITSGSYEMSTVQAPRPGGPNPSTCTAASASAPAAAVTDAADTVVRITGAVALGLEGDTTLGIITVKCEAAGTSALALSIDVLADATIGDPQETAAHVTDGEVTCGDGGSGATPDS